MYEAFYGMKVRPFALTPDPSFLFMSRKHRSAFSMLEYALTGQAGFTVITGAIGSGKTTLIRHLLKRMDRGTNYGVISNTHESLGDLLHWILAAFGISVNSDDPTVRYQAFVRYLIAQFGDGKQTILIVDEAQNLSLESLEQLRLLSNINADEGHQLLQMILVGQPELLTKLRRPELVQFAQRISENYHLSPLNVIETKGYIRHRLQVSGVGPELFTDEAMQAVFYFTNGVPRMINAICDMALVYGYAESATTIDIDIVLNVIRDKQKGALLPLCNVDQSLDRDAVIQAINASASASIGDGAIADDIEDVIVSLDAVKASRGRERRNPPIEETDFAPEGDELDEYESPPPMPQPVRLSSANAIMPIVSQRSHGGNKLIKKHWLLRFL
jgi:general secretion pathway protein A